MTGHVHSYSFYMRLCSLLHLIVDENSSAVILVVLISQKIAMKRDWCGTCNIGPIVLQATIPKHCKRALWYCCYDNETTTEDLWLHNLPCCKRLTISFCHIRLPIKHTWITRETLRRRFVARNWFVIWLICYLSIFAMLYYSYILRPSYYEDTPPPPCDTGHTSQFFQILTTLRMMWNSSSSSVVLLLFQNFPIHPHVKNLSDFDTT